MSGLQNYSEVNLTTYFPVRFFPPSNAGEFQQQFHSTAANTKKIHPFPSITTQNTATKDD